MRFASVALACALAVPSVAQAAAPSRTGASATPEALRVAGLRVTWPVQGTSVERAPGARVVVEVRRERRTGSRATVTLARVDGRGRTLGVLARRTLRGGRFAAKLATTPGARHELRLDVAGRRRATARLTTRVQPSPGTTGGAVPVSSTTGTTPPVVLGPCVPPAPATDPSLRAAGELVVTTTTVLAGATATYDLVNTGARCLVYGAGYDLERRRDEGGWERVGLELASPGWAGLLAPGERAAKGAQVPPGTPPGRYRVVDHLNADGTSIPLHGEFDVVAPAG
ncbi:hypothetical protein [Conexibacter sp. SYSU D00693]|uniref:hypothetical protein n=1 Tax=Conexibacter sp. SYSU D00693 TaxID=2812560 RepID=UPI00196A4701|nr:hypothetical protein [Conexibacter sp. SYSU D00693]